MAEMERKKGERESHMANKQMGRHMDKAFGGKETPAEEHAEGGHQTFHVSHHPEHGTHSTHTHSGGIDHAEHASPEEAMEHGKQAMGSGGMSSMPAAPAMSEEEQWA